MDGENTELIIVIILIFVTMGTYYFYSYREYSKIQEALKKNRLTPQCPDYWKSVGDNKCQNIKKLGRCNLGNDNIMDFSGKLYEKDINKCMWSKFCESSWEGVDHLCV